MDSKMRATEPPATASQFPDESVTEAVVTGVAEAEGVSPQEVDPPLYSVIDADALERFVASIDGSDAEDAGVSFEYAGHEVTVSGTGEVRVDG
jgi:hypothetical protein